MDQSVDIPVISMSSPFMFLLIFGGIELIMSARFTNLKCEVLDPTYCAYRRCDLKITGRGIVALNVHAKLLKGPFNNAKVNVGLWRKFSGFRPFMFNKTVDFCKFLVNAPKLSFERIVMDVIQPSSNLNHTCPYKDEIVVRNLVLRNELLKFLPLPSGEYQIQIMAATDNEWKTRIAANFLVQEDMLKS